MKTTEFAILGITILWNPGGLLANQERPGVQPGIQAPGAGAEFIRGDSNQDGSVDFLDGLHTLHHLFLGTPVPCADALDHDDNGHLLILDGLLPLYTHFLGIRS